MRRNGKSLGEMIKDEIGPVTGLIAMIGILGIMIILLAVLALVVVKALVGSPWGMFTIAATIPIAILMSICATLGLDGLVKGQELSYLYCLLLRAVCSGKSSACKHVHV